MKIIKKHLFLLTLITIYLITRLYNLLLLPIFTDESIYIYWAKVIETSYSQWGLSLTDGKPPLLTWIIAIFLKIFPQDWYLAAGRLPSIIAGAITLLGIYQLGKILLKSTPIAITASLLYILNPFSLFYDRLALFDSLLTSMLIWTVYFAIKTSQTKNIKDSIMWGSFLGLGFLSKPTAIIFLILTPLIYLILRGKKALTEGKKTLIFILIPIIASEILNNLQRFSSVYYLFEAKNQQFQQPIEKLLKEPFALTWGNLQGFFSWIIPYDTWPVFLIGLFAFIVLFLKKPKIGSILFILWFAPIFILATVGREIFPRYILFTTPYFLIAVAYGLYLIFEILRGAKSFEHAHSPIWEVRKKILATSAKFLLVVIVFFILLPSLKFDYLLLTNPPQAPLPQTDYNQYIGEHPSGYGLDKIFTFLDTQLQKEPITLVTQGTFGLYHYAFALEYWNNPNLTIIPRWPLSILDQEIFNRAKSQKIYILLKEHDQIPPQLPLDLILKAEKPGGKYPLLLTTIKIEELQK